MAASPWRGATLAPLATNVRESRSTMTHPEHARSLRAARAAKSAENLPADRVVPIPKGGPGDQRPRGPRAPAQNLVIGGGPEKQLGILFVRECLVSRVGREVAGGPLPHVTNHPVATDRRDVARVRANRGGTKCELIDIRERVGWRLVTPWISARATACGIPRCRRLPFQLRGQPLPRPTGVGFGL